MNLSEILGHVTGDAISGETSDPKLYIEFHRNSAQDIYMHRYIMWCGYKGTIQAPVQAQVGAFCTRVEAYFLGRHGNPVPSGKLCCACAGPARRSLSVHYGGEAVRDTLLHNCLGFTPSSENRDRVTDHDSPTLSMNYLIPKNSLIPGGLTRRHAALAGFPAASQG